MGLRPTKPGQSVQSVHAQKAMFPVPSDSAPGPNPVNLVIRRIHDGSPPEPPGGGLPMDAHRTERVSEAVREELAEIIGFELLDPRLGLISVTDVRVAPDMRNASVKVGLSGDDREQRQALAALDHARGYLRHELARRLNLRRAPELHFESDRFTDVDSRVDLLLKRARRTRPRGDSPAENESGGDVAPESAGENR